MYFTSLSQYVSQKSYAFFAGFSCLKIASKSFSILS